MQATDRIKALIEQRRALRQSILDLKAKIAGNRSAFYARGVHVSPLERANLDAQLAQLEAEHFRTDGLVRGAESIRIRLRATSMLATISRLLSERGLGTLMDQARDEAEANDAQLSSEAEALLFSPT